MRAAIYLRISDDREGAELGIDRQKTDCHDLVKRHGGTVVQTYADNDISASTLKTKARPEYLRMLLAAKNGQFDVIVAYTTSRLTRRPREHEDLIDLAVTHGIKYLFVRSPGIDLNSADGRHVARMLAAGDAAEAERTAERVKRAVKQRAEKGEYHGGPRGYGITADGTGLVEEEASRVRSWYEHVIAGGSLWSIAADLNRRFVPTTTGKTWRSPVIRKILVNPRNAGYRLVDGVERRTPHPPIVSRDVYDAASRILTDESRRHKDSSAARKHLGTGLFRCERCGVTVNTGYGHGGHLVYRCLRCYRQWRADPITEFAEDLVTGLLAKEDARDRLLPDTADSGHIAALRAEDAAIRSNMEALAVQFVTTTTGVTRGALAAGLEAGERRLTEIANELATASRSDPMAPLLGAIDPVRVWHDLDLSRKQAVIRVLFTLFLGTPQRGRVAFDPSKVIRVEWQR